MLYRRESRNHTEWMGHHGPKRGPIHQWQSTGEDWVKERSENKLFLKEDMYVWGISVAKRENRTSCTGIICHYTDKIVDHMEKWLTSATSIQNRIRQSYMLMLINHAENMNNCEARNIFRASDTNFKRWKQQKEKMTDTNSTQKHSSGLKNGHLQELEQ